LGRGYNKRGGRRRSSKIKYINSRKNGKELTDMDEKVKKKQGTGLPKRKRKVK
jgi:hypothetical protein